MKRRLASFFLLILTLLVFLSGCFGTEPIIQLDDVPPYSDSPYVKINGNVPFFDEDEITAVAFESYSPLDALGRCGTAVASIGVEIMPTEERGEISSVTPSGWKHNGKSNNKMYDGEYLYNRCHLIGHQLAGEDANERNLITGTRYLNIKGMLPFENQVADYVKETKNHVMLRVTPIYSGNDYVARGVLMEGYSVEDGGEGIQFCVYAYNVQPGVEINYFNGTNRKKSDTQTDLGQTEGEQAPANPTEPPTYVLNVNSKKYHEPACRLSSSMKEENREEYYGEPGDFLSQYPGYSPCKSCNPQ